MCVDTGVASFGKETAQEEKKWKRASYGEGGARECVFVFFK